MLLNIDDNSQDDEIKEAIEELVKLYIEQTSIKYIRSEVDYKNDFVKSRYEYIFSNFKKQVHNKDIKFMLFNRRIRD